MTMPCVQSEGPQPLALELMNLELADGAAREGRPRAPPPPVSGKGQPGGAPQGRSGSRPLMFSLVGIVVNDPLVHGLPAEAVTVVLDLNYLPVGPITTKGGKWGPSCHPIEVSPELAAEHRDILQPGEVVAVGGLLVGPAAKPVH